MSEFTEAARARQTRFRDNSSTITDPVRSPSDSIGRRHGYLLALGCEQENLYPSLRGDDGVLKFFEERGIQWHHTQRSGDTRGSHGPTRHMMSSQLACVNFLLPLCAIPGALRAVVRSIDANAEEVVDICHEDRVSPLEFEWIGVERSLERGRQRGANNTSVDAFMVASKGLGRCAYLIEWKYGEEYSRRNYKGKGRSGDTRRGRYTPLYSSASSPFDGSVPMDEFLYEPFYQAMRLRLLADRMVREGELGVSDAKVVVVVPKGNTTFSERITSSALAERFPSKNVEAVVKASLKRPDSFAMIDPATLVNAVEQECGQVSSEWVAYQKERYGWDA